jgi:hypothetical protein
VKLDGYRAQALCDGVEVWVLSRTGKDLGQRFPAVLRHLQDAIPNGSVIDGELVALDPHGRPSFNLLQNYPSSNAPIVYFAFDLLQLAGEDISKRPLAERRDLLKTSLRVTDLVQLSESFSIPSKQMLELVREHGLEGVVAKNLRSSYKPGRRSGSWVKLRMERAQGRLPNFNAGLSLFYGMGGVRMRVPNHTDFQPFGQALFGGVHGFDGYFPAPVGRPSDACSEETASARYAAEGGYLLAALVANRGDACNMGIEGH